MSALAPHSLAVNEKFRDHITDIIAYCLINNPKGDLTVNDLGHISAYIMNNPLKLDVDVVPLPLDRTQMQKQNKFAENCAKLHALADKTSEDLPVKVPDLLEEANLIEWSGITLGHSEVFRLKLSIQKLAASLPAEVERLRLFGRISTQSTPYYIVEGLNPVEEENVDEKIQEGRNGVNKYAYWATQSIESASWIKLPNVNSEQIVAARQFKRFFTGDLQAPVPSYPPFNGNEANLLRTQIACIVGSTSISPDGYYTLSEDDPPAIITPEKEALNESFPKSCSDLKDPEAWKHHEVKLNKLGRVTAFPEQLDDAGEVVEPEEPVDVNPPLDAIKPEQWAFRVCNNSVVAARSLLWPGAVAVANGRRYVNIYVGYGVCSSPVIYSPRMIGSIQSEWTPSEDSLLLVVQSDVRVDPTPPMSEGKDDEE